MRALYDIPAPAKLNLFLHITGRRADGYHLLQSVLMLIDWCDTLHVELRPNNSISREDLTHPLPPDDLCLRAARALQAAVGGTQGAHIGIAKSIPAQAGMGGGSSDAASVLLTLNRLWKLHLSRQQLAAIGLSLGADVPFFIHGHNAWVEGIGDMVTPLTEAQQPPAAQFIVVKPTAGLDTASIFSQPSLQRDCNHATIAGFAAAHYQFGTNVLQSVAQRLCPEVQEALAWLASLGLQGRMTGSGSAVFAQIAHTFELPKAPAAWQVKICHNLRLHPLQGWAADEKTAG